MGVMTTLSGYCSNTAQTLITRTLHRETVASNGSHPNAS
jgi:hypothetical protein